MDMQWWWLRTKFRSKIINIYWKPGTSCKADYYTKHHNGTHHQRVRPQYVLNNIENSQTYDIINNSDEGMLRYQLHRTE